MPFDKFCVLHYYLCIDTLFAPEGAPKDGLEGPSKVP